MGIRNLCTGVFLSVLIVTMAQPTPESADPALKAVASGVNRFALSLLKAAIETKGADKNILVSPLSASLATAMVYQGAMGDTKAELQKGLNFPADDKQFERGVSLLNDNLNNVPGVTLEVANRVFLEKTLESKVKPTFSDALMNLHKSSLSLVDFVSKAEPARLDINKWVSDKTHDKIKDLLAPGTVDASTAMVLVNALYFKGKWKDQFKAENTQPADFHLTKDRKVNVSMMYRSGSMKYAEVPELKAKVLSLPYEGERVRMVLVLPDEIDGLSGVLDKLTSGAVNLETIQYYNPEVRLWLPKFKIEDSHNLKTIYQKLGMGKMFTAAADFSGMVEPPPPLAVSEAVQKTFMEVNEEGTEAAAATAAVMMMRMSFVLPREPEVFKVDRPSLLILQNIDADYDDSSILFTAVLQDPTQ